MVQHKTSDQYLTTGKVSTTCRSILVLRRYILLKTLTTIFHLEYESYISKSMTLTQRLRRLVMMVEHKSSDKYLTTGKVSTRSIVKLRRYRLLKTFIKNFNARVTAIALPVLRTGELKEQYCVTKGRLAVRQE